VTSLWFVFRAPCRCWVSASPFILPDSAEVHLVLPRDSVVPGLSIHVLTDEMYQLRVETVPLGHTCGKADG
jgi:hypothetical protein